MSLSALYRLIWSWLGWFPDTVQSLCEFWEKLNAQRGVSKLKICHFCIIVNHKSWDSNICLWLSAEDESGGTAADTSVSHGNVTKQNLTSIKLSSSRTLNCPPAPNVHKRLEQEDRRQFSLCLCWRPHSHCQLTEVDLSRSSFMTTAEPRWQSVHLAGCCLSYQAVVRVVHPAAPCLPPSARCCWGVGRRSISWQQIGRQRPCFCLCVFESWHSLWTLLSDWSVWTIITVTLTSVIKGKTSGVIMSRQHYILPLFSCLEWFLFNFEYLNSIFIMFDETVEDLL